MNKGNVKQHKRGFPYYRYYVENEASEQINRLLLERDATNTPTLEEINELTAQIDGLEKGIRDRYRDSFRANPKEILTVIKAELPEYDIESFKGLLRSRRRAYEDIIKDYSESEEIPLFAKQFKTSSEETYENYFDFLVTALRSEMEVADYYEYKEEAESIIGKYASKFYKPTIPDYETVLNTKMTNAITQLPNRKLDFDEDSGDFYAVIPFGGTQMYFSIDPTGVKLPPAQAHKVLDIFISKISQSIPRRASYTQIMNHTKYSLSVKEYMELCGLSDPKSAKEQLAKSVEWLFHVSGEWDEVAFFDYETGHRLKEPTDRHFKYRILITIGDDTGKAVSKGVCHVEIHPRIAQYISYGFPMNLPTKLYKMSSRRNPNSYQIGKRLAIHKNMNVMKANENRIAVATLLPYLQNIPSYEEVMKSGKHISRDIIEPFERDLSALIDEGVLTDAHYCNSGGEPITDEQLNLYTYKEWITWLIEFEFADYPEQEERRQFIEDKRAEKRKQRIVNKAKQELKKS